MSQDRARVPRQRLTWMGHAPDAFLRARLPGFDRISSGTPPLLELHRIAPGGANDRKFRNSCASGWASAFRRLRLSGWRCHLPKTAMTSPRRCSSPKATGWRRPTRFSIRPENSLPRCFCVINPEPSVDLSACCPRFTAVIGKSAVLQPASASDLRRDHSERNLRKLLCSHSSSGSFGGDAT